MNAEFQWWLLILGIVIGGALVYLVLADVQGDRDEDELGPDERPIDELDDVDDETGWSMPAAPQPAITRRSTAPVPADPVATDPATAPEGPTSVRHDAGVQRDGAQGETTVADLP